MPRHCSPPMSVWQETEVKEGNGRESVSGWMSHLPSHAHFRRGMPRIFHKNGERVKGKQVYLMRRSLHSNNTRKAPKIFTLAVFFWENGLLRNPLIQGRTLLRHYKPLRIPTRHRDVNRNPFETEPSHYYCF